MAKSNVGAVSIAPVFLRLAVGLTFLWAGLGKIMAREGVMGDDAAWLAKEGVIAVPAPVVKDGEPKHVVISSDGPRADQFTEPVQVRRVYKLAVFLKHAGEAPSGKSALWPRFLAEGATPIRMAWGAGITEALGGAFLVVGLFTRLSGFALAVVIATASWLTQLGPAMQSGDATLWIFPKHEAFDSAAWQTLWWQALLFAGAMALFFAGSGTLAFDRVLFGSPKEPEARPRPPSPTSRPV